MPRPIRASLITITLIAGLDLAAVGFGTAAAQGSQQEWLTLNSANQQAVTQGLADQPAHTGPGCSGQIGGKLPTLDRTQLLPSDVQAQVPDAKTMLFVKLSDRILLIDPYSQTVAEIVLAPATTDSVPDPAAE